MPGKVLRFMLVFLALLIIIPFGSGFASDAGASLGGVAGAKAVTMAEILSGEPDRAFDYSFSFRFVKRGETAYYVRYNSLFICEGPKSKMLLDNALVYWMYIDERRDLWFCVGGSADITGSQIVERESLYHYDRSKELFRLVKRESRSCTFSNRFYRSYFLYLERGYLKAYDTSDGSILTIDRTDSPAVVAPDGVDALYYTDRRGRQIMLTNLGERSRRKQALKQEDFPMGAFSFDEYFIGSGQPLMALYKFCGTGYARICDFPPVTDGMNRTGTTFFGAEEGIYAVEDSTRAYVEFYSFSTKAWSRIGDGDAADQFGRAEGRCWFYTCTQPVKLYVFESGKVGSFDFGSLVEDCSSIRVMNGKAYVFRYDGDWLSYVVDMKTQTLYRITD